MDVVAGAKEGHSLLKEPTRKLTGPESHRTLTRHPARLAKKHPSADDIVPLICLSRSPKGEPTSTRVSTLGIGNATPCSLPQRLTQTFPLTGRTLCTRSLDGMKAAAYSGDYFMV